MSVTFEVIQKDGHPIVRTNASCFGPLSAINSYLNSDIVSIDFLPFTYKNYEGERIHDTRGIKEKEYEAWWSFLNSLKFFSEVVINHENRENWAFDRIKFTPNVPADQLLITMFMYRAPQDKFGIVKYFYELTNNTGYDPFYVFVMLLVIEPVGTDKDRFYINPWFSTESTLINGETFSIYDFRKMVKNFYRKNYSKKHYSGKQPIFQQAKVYRRFENQRRKSLCRFFSQSGRLKRDTGNLRLILLAAMDPHRKDVFETKRSLMSYANVKTIKFKDDDLHKAYKKLVKIMG